MINSLGNTEILVACDIKLTDNTWISFCCCQLVSSSGVASPYSADHQSTQRRLEELIVGKDKEVREAKVDRSICLSRPIGSRKFKLDRVEKGRKGTKVEFT